MAIETNFCSQTNWTVLSGSLLNCITFQTPFSFSDDDDEESSHNPLLLHSPALNPSPCEITINFTEKFEVRQVYVRSTAKVFEVYCAPDSKSGNEYLCTVRCGVATRDGEVLRPLGYKDSGEESAKSEDDWVEVKNVDDPSIENTDQDFFEATAVIDNMNPCISITVRLLSLQRRGYVWVDEVYVFGDPVEIEPETQESHNENTSRNALMAMYLPALMQMSMTTGLSQLNAVREENQFVIGDNLKEIPHPGGSILENQLKGKASIMDQEKLKEIKGEESEISNGSNKMQSDRASVPPQVTQMDSNCSAMPSKIPEMENNHYAVPSQVAINQGDFSGGNVERAVEKLKSQMDRIEEICLSFQEKMVLPMNSIETRLQRVEQQLEALSKKSQNPALPSGYRISAPDVSFVESDANSCENGVDYTDTREVESHKKYSHAEEVNADVNDMSDSENTKKSQNPALPSGYRISAPDVSFVESDANSCENGVDYTDTREAESDKKYSHAEEVNADVNDISDSENTTQLLPGLIVTAPEFPEGEDEEDNASEQTMTSNHKEKQSIGENEEDNASGETITSNQKVKQSIDDALSSAFANFVSSVSLESAKSKGISVKAPEFTDEDDDDHESNNTINSYGVESSIGTLSTDEDDDDESSIGTLSTDSDEDDDDDNEMNNGTQNTEVIVFTDSDQDEVCVNASILPDHNLKTDVKEKENLKKSGKCQNSEASTSISRLISNEMIAKHFPVGDSISCSTYAGLEPEHVKDNVKEKENQKVSGKCQNSEASASISRLFSNEMIAKHFPVGDSISCSTYAGLEPEHVKDNVKEKENQKVSGKCQNSEASASISRFISNGMIAKRFPVGGSISCSTYAGLEPEHIKDNVKEKENQKVSGKCQNSEASASISRFISNGMIAKRFPVGGSISCSTYAGLEPEHIKDNVKEKENQKVSEKCQNSEASTSNSHFISNGMVNYPGRCEKCQNPHKFPGGCGFPWDDGLSARTKHTAATKPALKTFVDKSLCELPLGFPDPPPVIDFKFPVSEMEFMSYIDPRLGKKPDTSPRDSSVMESNEDISVNEQPQVNADLSVEKHSNLILVKEQVQGNDDLSVEDHSNLISVYEPMFPASSNNFDLLEMLGYIEPEPVNIEGGDLAEDNKGMHDESSTPSSPIGGHDLEEFNDTSMHDLLSTLSPFWRGL